MFHYSSDCFNFDLSIDPLSLFSATMIGAFLGFGILQAGFHRFEGNNLASIYFSAGIPLGSAIGIMAALLLGKGTTLIFGFAFVGTLAVVTMLIFKGQAWRGFIPSFKHFQADLFVLMPFLIISVFGWLGGYGMNFLYRPPI